MTFNFDYPNRRMSVAKPVNLDEGILRTIPAEHRMIQRKHDGLRMLLVKGSRPRVFSRRWDNLSDLFPDITMNMDGWPEGTILDCEFVVRRDDDTDDFTMAQRICRSSSFNSLMSRKQVQGRWDFMAFDLLYLSGLPAYQTAYRDRYRLMTRFLEQFGFDGLTQSPLLDLSFEEAVTRADRHNWEGLMLWDARRSTIVREGKAARTNVYRWKPHLEEDVVATGFEWAAGALTGAMGALLIARRNDDGTLTPCGKVGSGFSQADRVEALDWAYPTVITVRYDYQLNSGLRFPRFIRKHADKAVTEC